MVLKTCGNPQAIKCDKLFFKFNEHGHVNEVYWAIISNIKGKQDQFETGFKIAVRSGANPIQQFKLRAGIKKCLNCWLCLYKIFKDEYFKGVVS